MTATISFYPFLHGYSLEACETRTRFDLAEWFSGLALRLQHDRERGEGAED